MACTNLVPNTFIMCGEDYFAFCSNECLKKNLIEMINKLASENSESEKLKLKKNILKILNFVLEER